MLNIKRLNWIMLNAQLLITIKCTITVNNVYYFDLSSDKYFIYILYYTRKRLTAAPPYKSYVLFLST
jgi:hypothetical protein